MNVSTPHQGENDESALSGVHDRDFSGQDPEARRKSVRASVFPAPPKMPDLEVNGVNGVHREPRALEEEAPARDSFIPSLLPIDQKKLMHVLHELARESRYSCSEHAVRSALDVITALAPRRVLVVRLLNASTGKMQSLHTTAELKGSRSLAPDLSREAAARHGLSPADLAQLGVRVVDRYQPFSSDEGAGQDFALISLGRVVGLLGVEYPKNVPLPGEDVTTFGIVALQMSSAIEAARVQRKVVRQQRRIQGLEHRAARLAKLANLGEWAAQAMHELNNPLTSIGVYADYLLKKLRDTAEPDDLRRIHRIAQDADRMRQLTRNLGAYAKPEEALAEVVSVHDMLDDSLAFCEHQLKQAGVNVNRVYGESLPGVRAVRAHLHQVFINLITNAAQAMPPGAGELTITTGMISARELSVTVADNGEGIPLEHRERIFEPFFTTRGGSDGTGLGLSIVKGLVEQCGGEVRIARTGPSGTEFEIILPCETTLAPDATTEV